MLGFASLTASLQGMLPAARIASNTHNLRSMRAFCRARLQDRAPLRAASHTAS